MLSNVFEEVYVINMSRRSERLRWFYEQLPNDWPFQKPLRYEAVDGGIVTPPSWWNGGNGAWGCYKTHLRILEDCLNRNIGSVLILEDDAVCVGGFHEKAELFWQHLPDDWEMLYLGGQHLQENVRLPRKINDWVYQPFNVNRCHCYGFRGRRMMEKAYRHLHDYESWKVPHHVDHYLGELHKKMERGIYVPREWLVAQSGGQSDICGRKLEMRLFPGAEETLSPKIDLPCVALMGTYFGGINTLACVMHALGFHFGTRPDMTQNSHTLYFFEEAALSEICRNCFAEPWLEETLPHPDRVNHLRRWAGMQCKSKPESAKILCGKHPILSLMGPELMEAWNCPKILCADRPDNECWESMKQMTWGWHPEAAKHAFESLRRSRETFFEKTQPDLLKFDYAEMKSSPEAIISRICDFLDHESSDDQRRLALKVITESRRDCCVL